MGRWAWILAVALALQACGAVEPDSADGRLVDSSARAGGDGRVFEEAGGPTSWNLRSPSAEATSTMLRWHSQLEDAVRTGQPLTIPAREFVFGAAGALPQEIEPEDFEVLLAHSDMLRAETFFQINTIPHRAPFLRVYEGRVAGAPDTLVHLMISDHFLRGAIRVGESVYLIRIGTNGNVPYGIAPVGEAPYEQRQPRSDRAVGCPEDHIPGNTRDTPGVNGGHRLVPPYVQAGALLGEPAPELVARIILDADLEAYQNWGPYLPALMVAMHVEQSLTYRHEVGIRFRIVGVHINTLPGYYPEPLDTPQTFDFMEAWWGTYLAEQRDIVHLLTGQPIETLMASCIGAAGTPYGFFFTSTALEERGESFRNMNIVSHEIGHLFSAHHHYANPAEHGTGNDSIMAARSAFDNQPVFSSLSRAVIRGWAEEYLEPAP